MNSNNPSNISSPIMLSACKADQFYQSEQNQRPTTDKDTSLLLTIQREKCDPIRDNLFDSSIFTGDIFQEEESRRESKNLNPMNTEFQETLDMNLQEKLNIASAKQLGSF